ncbi:MAG: helix-turn-helix domain-containing protein [Bdellovibrionales bacterium]
MLNEALKVIRQFHGLKLVELADQLKVSKSYLSQIETGQRPNISIDLLNKYSERFKIPVSSILFFSETLKDQSPAELRRQFVSKKLLALLKFVARGAGRE